MRALVPVLAGVVAVAAARAEAQSVSSHLDLINHCPSQASLARLSQLGGEHFIHRIQSAMSDTLMLDEYVVRIDVPPRLAPGDAEASPQQLLDHIRRNFPDFLDHEIVDLAPYRPLDASRWASAAPLGSIMKFDVYGRLRAFDVGAAPPALPKVPVDTFIVVATHVEPTRWLFSTAHSPEAFIQNHPLSGVREFGIRRAGNTLEFYTRAVDRPTGVLDTIFQEQVYKGVHATWLSLQRKTVEFVNQRGGAATALPVRKAIKSWKADVTGPGLFRPNCSNAVTASFGTPLNARTSQAALALLSERDATGVNKALLDAALPKLARRPNERAKAALLKDISDVAGAARRAEKPAQVLGVLESDAARRLGLVYRTPPWDSTSGSFTGTSTQDRANTMEGAARGESYRRADRSVTARLLSASNPGVDASTSNALFMAITGATSVPTVEGLSTYLAPRGGGTVRAILQVAGAARGADRAALDAVASGALRESARMIAQRTAEAKAAADVLRRGDAFQLPRFQSLLRENASADTLVGSARALSAAAAMTGNAALARDIQRIQGTVESGMTMYKGLSLLAGGFSGGTMVAALAVLDGASGLQGSGGGSEEMMNALAELAEFVREQFAVVNQKLDQIQLTLDRIAEDLRQLRAISSATLSSVEETRVLVLRLFSRIDALETNLTSVVVDLSISDCVNYLKLATAVTPDKRTFDDCLRKFVSIAKVNQSAPQLSTGTVLKDLAHTFPAGISGRPNAAWHNASMIAIAAAQYMELRAAASFAQPSIAQTIVAGRYTLDGVAGFLGLVRRYGRGWIAENHADYVTGFDLPQLLERLELVESFQQALVPDKPERLATLERVAGKLNEADGYPRVAEAIRGVARTSVLDRLMPELAGLITLPAAIPITACTAPHPAPPFSIPTSELIAAGVPADVLTFGIVVAGQRIAPTWNGSDREVGNLPRDGFRLCVDALSRPLPFAVGVVIENPIRGTLRVHQHGVKLLEFPYARSRGGGGWDNTHKDVILEALRQHFATTERREESRRAVADAFLASDLPAMRMAIAGAYHELLQQPDVSRTLETAFETTVGLHALLRGYFVIAYPGLYAVHDRLRSALEGSNAHRLPDIESVKGALLCARLTYLELVRAQKDVTDDRAHLLSVFRKYCPRDQDGLLDNLRLTDMARIFEPVQARFLEILRSTAWDTASDLDMPSTAWASSRLRQFIENGANSAFWAAVQ